MRDGTAVLVAITMRLDGTVSGLVQEVRAMHSQHSRLERRVRAMEPPASYPRANSCSTSPAQKLAPTGRMSSLKS